ncbi:GNAT family N-acetyltransferase [Kribbella antibiotica]|uniref:GNAT family N-acetyltransferase n=1 Tax=Kribbella antibiotica TaxID=190195 RepID=A0A4R4ZKG8_9ACTN|nr:GNAT family N-acetyltransferase [Kribbella antibiotica]TDD58660.1 GNAT family N-acetyltransferase [Kribbella antibiotica]
MELTERLERAEGEMIWALTQSPPDVLDALGVSGQRIGKGIVVVLRDDSMDYWSRASGFGFDCPIDSALLGEILDVARAAGGHALNFHLAPEVLPADWVDLCAEHGIVAGGTWVKAVREAGPVDAVPTDLRIGIVDPSEAAVWAATQIEVFGMPAEQTDLITAFASAPGCTPYGAWDGDKLVATGGLVEVGEVGECVSGTTLPAYRGRGAQSAILARRVSDAFAAGCRWVASETGKPGPGEHNSSLANMERVGFKIAYDRTIYRWTA